MPYAKVATTPHSSLHLPRKLLLVVLCLAAGVIPLAARWLPKEPARVSWGLAAAAIMLSVAFTLRRRPGLERYWELSFAFFVWSVVQVLNNTLPPLVAGGVLHEAPTGANPLASTVVGTVTIQLLETVITIVPIVWLTKAAGQDLGAIYARRGKIGGAFVIAVAVFVLLALFTASGRSARVLPTNGVMSLSAFFGLAPALLVLVISNGFQEEFLFRGLFLQRYEAFFGPIAANVLQAAIFTVAHASISYTPSALIFNVAFTLPLGLIAGYFMRRTNGVLTPAIFHAGLDIPIYWAFLTFAH